jgi:hypothetical protein
LPDALLGVQVSARAVSLLPLLLRMLLASAPWRRLFPPVSELVTLHDTVVTLPAPGTPIY